MMRKLLIVFGLWVIYTETNDFIDSIWPPEVKEEIVVETGENPVVTGTSTTTIDPVEPVVEKPWEPLVFNGKVGSFAEKHGGRVLKLKGTKQLELIKTSFGVAPKEGAIVNGDLYFRFKRKNYVIHKGKLINI